MSHTPMRVEDGAVVVLRMYDIAYAIDLQRVEEIWRRETAVAASRIRLTKVAPKAIGFDVPPVAVSVGSLEMDVDGAPVLANVTARLYDFGVVSFALRVPLGGMDWDAFTDHVNSVGHAAASEANAPLWTGLLERARTLLAPALVRSTTTLLEEDYLLATVRRFDRQITGRELREHVDLLPLLSGERRPLSEAARRDLLRFQFSYYQDDLVVLNWDRAFILEPSGDSDVADVLEVANAQFLEMRYYDELLDDELPRMYDRVEETRRTLRGLARRRFAHLARDLHTLVAEVTELTEKVDNALQVTEDVYLARIYGAALELFRVPTVSAAVDRKLSIIRDTYTALYDEASSRRAELLEISIVLLIVFEIALALATGH